jgi:hypothetical protein
MNATNATAKAFLFLGAGYFLHAHEQGVAIFLLLFLAGMYLEEIGAKNG